MQKEITLCPCKIWENLKNNPKMILIFLILSVCVVWIDQEIKKIILDGFRYQGDVISIVYILNNGVAFSMFEFLGEWLKWIQLAFVMLLGYGVLASKDLLKNHVLEFALIVGSGASNLYDRFVVGGVVDYVYWHYGFEFAIFNFADVMINLGIAIFILKLLFQKKTPSPSV